MVILDSDPQPLKYTQQTRLNKGAEVEVSSDGEGFRGAWYTATVVESPPKSVSKKRKKALIEYKTLVTQDGSAPLTEYVDPVYIRPLPPVDLETGGRFEENDIVDAGYSDGWWTGTITKVLEGSRYRIYFDNPPDVIDFNSRDLRLHWEWVDGKWVRPKKQQTTGSYFSSGTMVEVNIDKGDASDAWFPAIVIKENGNNTFLVKYRNSSFSNEDGMVKVVVDSLHIQPTPPRYADRDYELLEKVDAQYGFGWRPGVITKLLSRRRYNVFFKQGNEDKELNHSEIRPHVEWVDGKWIGKSKEVMIVSENQEQVGESYNSTGNPEMAVQLGRSGAVESGMEEKVAPSTSTSNQMEQSTDCNEGSPSFSLPSIKLIEEDVAVTPLSIPAWQLRKMPTETLHRKTICGLLTPKRARITTKSMVGGQPSAEMESPFIGNTINTKKGKVAEPNCQKVDSLSKKGRSSKLSFEKPQASAAAKESNSLGATAEDINRSEGKTKEAEIPLALGLETKGLSSSHPDYLFHHSGEQTLKCIGDQKNNFNDLVGQRMEGGGSSHERERGRPPKLAVLMPSAVGAGKEDHSIGDFASEMFVKDQTTNDLELQKQAGVESTVCQDASRERAAELYAKDCTTEENGMSIARLSENVADDDQPLSTWFGGIHTSTGLSSGISVNGWNKTRERQIVALESSATSDKGDRILDENQCLPFVKRSPIWKTVQAMEVFQIVPQTPHFCPLAECKEEYREGTAIGIMVTFASLFEKISSSQLDDSKSTFESTLESLVDLEKHGFDVAVLRGRVSELLSIKAGQGKLLDESKEAERQRKEHTEERRKLDDRIDDIENKITKLQEELASYKSKMEAKDLEISRLSSHISSMNRHINDTGREFEKAASAPWKLPL